jgi:catechol 1,2-dioxygenase
LTRNLSQEFAIMNGHSNDSSKPFISSDPFVASFTKACQAHAGPGSNARAKVILDSMMAHLHNFIREVDITPEEWLFACQALAKAGEITDEKRNEFILISDVLGVESLVDSMVQQRKAELVGNAGKGNQDGATPTSLPTSSAILGPFYRENAPQYPMGTDIVLDHSTVSSEGKKGETAFMHGRVLDAEGKPIAGVKIDAWHDAVNGYYEQQDPDQPDYNCRGLFTTDASGEYSFQCLKPVAYPIPYDNTAGDILRSLDRSPMRPAHIHLFVRAEGYVPLITQVGGTSYADGVFPQSHACFLIPFHPQIFDRSCPYIDNDSVFATKDDLIVDFLPSKTNKNVQWELPYDIRLAKQAPTKAP